MKSNIALAFLLALVSVNGMHGEIGNKLKQLSQANAKDFPGAVITTWAPCSSSSSA
jgi:hypothetical protein